MGAADYFPDPDINPYEIERHLWGRPSGYYPDPPQGEETSEPSANTSWMDALVRDHAQQQQRRKLREAFRGENAKSATTNGGLSSANPPLVSDGTSPPFPQRPPLELLPSLYQKTTDKTTPAVSSQSPPLRLVDSPGPKRPLTPSEQYGGGPPPPPEPPDRLMLLTDVVDFLEVFLLTQPNADHKPHVLRRHVRKSRQLLAQIDKQLKTQEGPLPKRAINTARRWMDGDDED